MSGSSETNEGRFTGRGILLLTGLLVCLVLLTFSLVVMRHPGTSLHETERYLDVLALGSRRYHDIWGRYPDVTTTAGLLEALTRQAKDASGPALDLKGKAMSEALLDEWGNPLVLLRTEDGRSCLIVSAGPDATLRTEDDLSEVLWQSEQQPTESVPEDLPLRGMDRTGGNSRGVEDGTERRGK